MLSILHRMNPAVCLGVGSSGNILETVVVEDDETAKANNDQDDRDDHAIVADEGSHHGQSSGDRSTPTKSGIAVGITDGGSQDGNDCNDPHHQKANSKNSFRRRCMMGGLPTPCTPKYLPDDDNVQPLLPQSELALRALHRTMPDILKCITASPPFATATNPSSDNSNNNKMRRKALRDYHARRTEAFQTLHDLTKKEKEYNRIVLVSNTHWDVIGVLSRALLASIEEEAATKNGTTMQKQKQQQKQQQQQQQSKTSKPSINKDRRLICWTINNLSIPYENKAIMALGNHSSTLLHALTSVIHCNIPESYLCCICLLNLTFLASAIRPVAFYVPSMYDGFAPPYSPMRSRSEATTTVHGNKSGDRTGFLSSRSLPWRGRSRSSSSAATTSSSRVDLKNLQRGTNVGGEGRISEVCGLVLGNPMSLLRVVEGMMVANATYLQSKDLQFSVQGLALRWACGFIRNVTFAGEDGTAEDNDADNKGGRDALSSGDSSTGRRGSVSDETIEEICILLSSTQIPRLVVQFVHDSPRRAVEWTKDSLEDICLGVMCNLARWSSSREALQSAGAVKRLERLEGLPGIHGYRARAIRCSLGVLPKQFG
eukprot:CAMPEP_0183731538 /NCGR_PEP_ID=MMETSP0737-20130205/35684_1 /TAXON_ID=385413 /ORGANISM="Thalassiosira miniscula, Strain CCMP1093" /LENGTH=598 /DNA_ID=CAMNT_0025964287 /DNA_START=40 /DNA_END=1836 /DNA_ORIENTATION=-